MIYLLKIVKNWKNVSVHYVSTVYVHMQWLHNNALEGYDTSFNSFGWLYTVEGHFVRWHNLQYRFYKDYKAEL